MRLAPWLAERGILENPALVDATQRHFARRFSQAAEELPLMTSQHPGLAESLSETQRWLGVSLG